MPDNWRDIDFEILTMRSVDWRVSQRGNLWARVTAAGVPIRVTVFENQRYPGGYSYVWSRDLGDGLTEEKHFSPTSFANIEVAKHEVLVACGYVQASAHRPAPAAAPVPVDATPPKPKRTGVPAPPPVRKIIL